MNISNQSKAKTKQELVLSTSGDEQEDSLFISSETQQLFASPPSSLLTDQNDDDSLFYESEEDLQQTCMEGQMIVGLLLCMFFIYVLFDILLSGSVR